MICLARVALLILPLAITGCASTFSGLGGTPSYACQAPVGAQCTSVSGVYANALHRLSEGPRPPQTLVAPQRLSETGGAAKISTPVTGTKPVTSLGATPATGPRSPSTPDSSLPALRQSDHATPITATAALRSQPRVLRLWIAPWEDADGDLHDAAVVHVVVDTGRWLIERIRPVPRNRLDGVKAPIATATTTQPSPEARPAGAPAAASGGNAVPSLDVLPTAR